MTDEKAQVATTKTDSTLAVEKPAATGGATEQQSNSWVPNAIFDTILGKEKTIKKPKEEKTAEPNPAKVDGEPTAETPSNSDDPAKTRPNPAKVVKPKRNKEEDDNRIAELAAQTAAKTVAKIQQQAQPAKQATAPAATKDEVTIADLPEDFQDEVEALLWLEQRDPRHKGKAKELAASAKKIEAYKQEWEKTNNGKEFDEEDTEHDDFFDRVDVAYDKRAVNKAKVEMAVEQRMAKEREHFDGQLKEVKRDKQSQDVAPLVARSQQESVNQIVQSFDPDIQKVLSEEGLQKLEQTDAVAAEAFVKGAQAAQALSGEITRIYTMAKHGHNVFDGGDMVHAEIQRMADELENQLIRLPEKDQVKGGRMFTRRQTFAAMSPEEQRSHWFLTDEELLPYAIKVTQDTTKDYYQKRKGEFDGYMAKMGIRKQDVAKPPAVNGGKEDGKTLREQSQQASNAAQRAAPTAMASAKTNTVAVSQGQAPQKSEDFLLNKVLGK